MRRLRHFANIPVVQEQLLVQAIPRFVGSLPPVQEFTANVARRPLPLVVVRRLNEHSGTPWRVSACLPRWCNPRCPVPQNYVAEALRLLDRPIAEQVIAVPSSCSSCPSRSRVFSRNSWWKCLLTPTRIALRSRSRLLNSSSSWSCSRFPPNRAQQLVVLPKTQHARKDSNS